MKNLIRARASCRAVAKQTWKAGDVKGVPSILVKREGSSSVEPLVVSMPNSLKPRERRDAIKFIAVAKEDFGVAVEQVDAMTKALVWLAREGNELKLVRRAMKKFGVAFGRRV
jgi:hypothetical protein